MSTNISDSFLRFDCSTPSAQQMPDAPAEIMSWIRRSVTFKGSENLAFIHTTAIYIPSSGPAYLTICRDRSFLESRHGVRTVRYRTGRYGSIIPRGRHLQYRYRRRPAAIDSILEAWEVVREVVVTRV